MLKYWLFRWLGADEIIDALKVKIWELERENAELRENSKSLYEARLKVENANKELVDEKKFLQKQLIALEAKCKSNG